MLKTLPSGSVQTCVTSPPYWGLRDYGVKGQLGLEKTPEEYTARMVEVFREVRRVLKADGTCWLNLGDSYAANGSGQVPQTKAHHGSGFAGPNRASRARNGLTGGTKTIDVSLGGNRAPGLKPKDLVGIPWRVAFALQGDGWYLRSDIIWHKPNPMPESVTDRPTKAHEYLFLLSKSAKYYYDADAVREPFADDRMGNPGGGGQYLRTCPRPNGTGSTSGLAANSNWTRGAELGGRNRRSVWTVSTRPYKGAHFATFPPKLIEPCILAGSRKGDVVLDPFSGAGTTGLVAGQHGRRYLGIELNPAYVAMAEERMGLQSSPACSPKKMTKAA